jgi:amino acid transporter
MKLLKEPTQKLSVRELSFLGLAFMAPTALAPLFNKASEDAHGAPALTATIAFLAVFVTAFSYKRLARDYDWHGSIYMYAKKSMHRYAGFLTGWTALLFYMLAVSSSVMIAARLLHDSIPFLPYVLIVLVMLFGAAVVNYIGPRFAAYICLALFLLVCASFFIYTMVCLMSVNKGVGNIISAVPFVPQGGNFFDVLLGGGAACMAFLGFESITSLSEETKDPQVKITRAMVISIIVAGVLFIIESYVTGLVLDTPNVDTASSSYSIIDAARKSGGPPMLGIYYFAMIFSGPLVAIVGQSAAARMLFTMGRTGTLPRKVFARRRQGTLIPSSGILFVVVFCLIASLLKSRLSMVTELMRFTGSLLFVMIHAMSLYKYFFLKQRTNPLTLRNFRNVFPEIVFPAFGFLFGFAMWINVALPAFVEGLIWLGAGCGVIALMYHFRHTKRLTSKESELSKEVEESEVKEVETDAD